MALSYEMILTGCHQGGHRERVMTVLLGDGKCCFVKGRFGGDKRNLFFITAKSENNLFLEDFIP